MSYINPYLNFAGNCEEAFNHYQEVFGGELAISRFSEMPGDQTPKEDLNKVMHVSLPMGHGQVLMGSDVPSNMGETVVGNNVQVSVAPSSSEEAKRIFDGLADGGTVVMPLEAQFWGAEFGACVDRFGVNWMVNYEGEVDA